MRQVKNAEGEYVMVEESSSDDGMLSEEEEVNNPRLNEQYDPKTDGKPKKGINWIAIGLLFLMIAPAIFQGMIMSYDLVQSTVLGDFLGISHRARLTAFYQEYNPRKLKDIDRTLRKYKGREDALFEQLSKKYTKRK